MRDHEPITIEQFNGLWVRGDREAAPLDHFVDCENVQYFHDGVETRDGLEVFQVGEEENGNIPNIRRLYTFVHNNQQSLLVLDISGNLFHTGSPTPLTPILSIPEMTDFAFVGIAGRAYISPHDGTVGLENEFMYVYLGDGTPARKAAGLGPTGAAMTVTPVGGGNIEKGIHIFGVVYEYDTGFLSQIGPDTFTSQNFTNNSFEADISGVPISPSANVVARRIVATKAINPTEFTGNLDGYEFFFVPEGRIPDNTATTITVNFYDVELLESASHLLDLFPEIPAGVLLTTYHERLVTGGFYGDPTDEDEKNLPSTLYISAKGEPEAIDQVEGIITVPLDGNPLTNAQEFRDILYAFKKTRTFAYSDNGDEPATWPLAIIDQGVGCSVHGIATVLDSGGINIEYLILIDFSGIMLFNGAYARPELTWKIADYWLRLDRSTFKEFQISNDSLNQRIYVTQGNQIVLYADYSNGLDPKQIKFAKWRFRNEITSCALINTDTFVIGAIDEVP